MNIDTTKKRLLKSIAARISEKALTQVEVAEKVGMDRAHLTKILSGNRKSVTIDLLLSIASKLGMKVILKVS